MAAHLLGDVLEFDVTAVDALLEFCGGRVDLTDLAQFIERGAQGRDDTRLFGRQGVVGFVERTLDVFGVAHRVALLFEFFLFAFHQMGLCEFAALEPQEVCVLTVALDVFTEFVELLLHQMVFFVSLLILTELCGVVGKDIDHTQLEILFVEQEVLML